MIKIGNSVIEFKTFPNGETLMPNIQIGFDKAEITFKYESDADLIQLMFVKKYLDQYNKGVSYKLIIQYMPYSRMDRSKNNSPFTLKYVSDFINSLNFYGVIIWEPHSDVTPALINNCEEKYYTTALLPSVLEEINFGYGDYIYYPDGGANKRYSSSIGHPSLTGIKHRDFESGKITSLDIQGEVKSENFKVLMIDDICSYGGTFLQGAEKLKQMGASEIYLLVGHCENSILQGEIPNSDLIDGVFTTDSIFSGKHEKIHVYKA